MIEKVPAEFMIQGQISHCCDTCAKDYRTCERGGEGKVKRRVHAGNFCRPWELAPKFQSDGAITTGEKQ